MLHCIAGTGDQRRGGQQIVRAPYFWANEPVSNAAKSAHPVDGQTVHAASPSGPTKPKTGFDWVRLR